MKVETTKILRRIRQESMDGGEKVYKLRADTEERVDQLDLL